MALERLFSPLEGKLKLKNRIVMLATTLHYTEEADINDRTIEFYAVRARGGAGLIISGTLSVDEYGGSKGIPRIDDDRSIPEYARMTKAVHDGGAKIAAQLGHQGRYVRAEHIGGKKPRSASASAAAHYGRDVPEEMSITEIKETINSFGQAARRAKTAGFDAVEILGSQGYLVNQFLSPASNKRIDEYGGSFENRLRFPLEVIAAIRKEVGADFPIIMRLCAAEFVPGGLTIEDTSEIARIYENAGVDILDLQVAWHESTVPSVYMVVPRGGFTYLSQAIKKAVSIPVIAVNRINDPLLAEEILREGKSDLIGMARALIADPELPNKAREGRLDEICPCVGCLEGCLSFGEKDRLPVTCLVNPKAGKEQEFASKPAGARKKKVCVVGGGPAGLEAALLLAQRGHDVVLFEKDAKFGGDLRLASLVPGKSELASQVNYLEKQLPRLGIKVRREEATPEKIIAEKPQAAIIATGATPTMPPIPGIENKNVIGYREVLNGAELGQKVVVIGAGGVGCDMAIYAAHLGAPDAETLLYLLNVNAITGEQAVKLDRGGRKVTLIEAQNKIGLGIYRQVRWVVLQDLRRLGVDSMTGVKVLEINDKGVLVEQQGKEQLIEADTVIVATGIKPQNALYQALKDKLPEVYTIGNANKVSDALAATGEAAEIAYRI